MTYFLLNVVEGIGRVNCEANQNDMGIRVGERAKTIVVFLTRCIPKSELDVLAIDFDIGNVVLENGGDIDLW